MTKRESLQLLEQRKECVVWGGNEKKIIYFLSRQTNNKKNKFSQAKSYFDTTST